MTVGFLFENENKKWSFEMDCKKSTSQEIFEQRSLKRPFFSSSFLFLELCSNCPKKRNEKFTMGLTTGVVFLEDGRRIKMVTWSLYWRGRPAGSIHLRFPSSVCWD